jgi:hypothetical protein
MEGGKEARNEMQRSQPETMVAQTKTVAVKFTGHLSKYNSSIVDKQIT